MPYVSHGQLDAIILAAMGYEQVLSRGIRNWAMSAALGFIAIGTVPYTGIDLALLNGGPASALAAWLATSFFSIITICSLAEITSAFPNSGAVYHWVGQLVPPRWAPLASYATGTLLLFGNVCNIAISAAGCAGWIGAIITSQSGADETPSAGATVGLTLAIVAAWAAINLQHITSLAWCYCAFAALHVLVALALVVTAYAITAPQGGGDPWTQWVNASGFSGGYAVMLSISSAIYSLAGYDAGAHLAEETLFASQAVPIGMVVSVCASAAVGLWLTVGLLYYTPAYILSSSSTSTENPQGIGSFGTLFGMLQAATGSKQGTNALAVIILLTLFTSGPALVTVTTRLVFAMARDGALPFSRALRYLHPKTETPAWALFAVVCTVYVFVLIQLGSLTAFQSIVNPYVAYTQVAYAVPIVLRFTVARGTFRRGPFHLGRFSEPFAWISVVWLLSTAVVYLWPVEAPVTEDTMNWGVVCICGFGVVASAWWIFWARTHYPGPRLRRGDQAYAGFRKNRYVVKVAPSPEVVYLPPASLDPTSGSQVALSAEMSELGAGTQSPRRWDRRRRRISAVRSVEYGELGRDEPTHRSGLAPRAAARPTRGAAGRGAGAQSAAR